jgi:hypothetical protein
MKYIFYIPLAIIIFFSGMFFSYSKNKPCPICEIKPIETDLERCVRICKLDGSIENCFEICLDRLTCDNQIFLI